MLERYDDLLTVEEPVRPLKWARMLSTSSWPPVN